MFWKLILSCVFFLVIGIGIVIVTSSNIEDQYLPDDPSPSGKILIIASIVCAVALSIGHTYYSGYEYQVIETKSYDLVQLNDTDKDKNIYLIISEDNYKSTCYNYKTQDEVFEVKSMNLEDKVIEDDTDKKPYLIKTTKKIKNKKGDSLLVKMLSSSQDYDKYEFHVPKENIEKKNLNKNS